MRRVAIKGNTVHQLKRSLKYINDALYDTRWRSRKHTEHFSHLEAELDEIHRTLNKLSRRVDAIVDYLEEVEESEVDDGK